MSRVHFRLLVGVVWLLAGIMMGLMGSYLLAAVDIIGGLAFLFAAKRAADKDREERERAEREEG